MNENQIIDPPTLEAEFGLPRRLQLNLRQTRQLPYFKVGHRSVRYRRGDVEAFFKARRIEAVRIGGGA